MNDEILEELKNINGKLFLISIFLGIIAGGMAGILTGQIITGL